MGSAFLARPLAPAPHPTFPDAWKVLNLLEPSPVWRTRFKVSRGLEDSAFTQAEREALAATHSDPTVALAQQRLDANLAAL